MKKILAIMVIAISTSTFADVNVNWLASGGFYFNATPGVGILGSGTGNSTIAQLIYSIDGNVNDALIGGGVSGDDALWGSLTITEDGNDNDGTTFDSYALFPVQNYTQTYTSGFVYARIFQDNSIDFGDWYYASTPIPLQDIIGSNPAQTVQLNANTITGDAIDSGLNTHQVIPEPASALLLALGGGLVWMVRKKQRLL